MTKDKHKNLTKILVSIVAIIVLVVIFTSEKTTTSPEFEDIVVYDEEGNVAEEIPDSGNIGGDAVRGACYYKSFCTRWDYDPIAGTNTSYKFCANKIRIKVCPFPDR